jgi:uncharacterized protein YjbJ (UPF0337 family)
LKIKHINFPQFAGVFLNRMVTGFNDSIPSGTFIAVIQPQALQLNNNQGGKLLMINEGQGTFREEASAVGDQIEGQAKNAYGSVTGNTSVEREGENQAAMGSQRQEQNRMLTGLFRDRDSAERAYSSVRSRGYTDDDVNVLMSDQTRDSCRRDHRRHCGHRY